MSYQCGKVVGSVDKAIHWINYYAENSVSLEKALFLEDSVIVFRRHGMLSTLTTTVPTGSRQFNSFINEAFFVN